MNWFERQELDRKLAKLARLEEESAQLRKDVEDYSRENEKQREQMTVLRDALAHAEEWMSENVPSNSWGLLDRTADEARRVALRQVRAAIESVASILPEVANA